MLVSGGTLYIWGANLYVLGIPPTLAVNSLGKKCDLKNVRRKNREKSLDTMNSSWSFMWSVTLICIPGEWKPVEGVIKYTESGKLRLFNRTVQPGCEYLPVFLTSAGFNAQQEWSAVLTVRSADDVVLQQRRQRHRTCGRSSARTRSRRLSVLFHGGWQLRVVQLLPLLHTFTSKPLFLRIPLRLHVRTVHTWVITETRLRERRQVSA